VLSTRTTGAYLELVAQFREGVRTQGHHGFHRNAQRARSRLADGDPTTSSSWRPGDRDQIKLGKAVVGAASISRNRGTGLAVRKGRRSPTSVQPTPLRRRCWRRNRSAIPPARRCLYAQRVRETGYRRPVKGKLKQTPSGVFVGTLIASARPSRLPADQRAGALRRHRLRRPAAGRAHGMTVYLRRHPRRREAGGGRQGAGQIHHPAGRAPVIRKHGLERIELINQGDDDEQRVEKNTRDLELRARRRSLPRPTSAPRRPRTLAAAMNGILADVFGLYMKTRTSTGT